ncbi:MAG: response regulator [Sinimarinibacterium sp.]|jgi:DNA-binding NarL/FixJ family response regulator
MAYTVLLVEDDPRTRERLAAAIAEDPGLQLLATAGNCAQARAELDARTPDALLLDLGLPDGDGGDLIPEALRAGTRIIVMSVFDSCPRQRAALAAGAHGCLLKDSSPRAIGRAVVGLFAAPNHMNS